jgi:hypothetical protein
MTDKVELDWRSGAEHLKAHSLDSIGDAIAEALKSLTGQDLSVLVHTIDFPTEGIGGKARLDVTVRAPFKEFDI